ncbi:hypothetical protein SAMN05444920_12229 [Nonomuraea solani]|uniref:Uncharacterized protein n=1 Tax=Nonomuraea solani TaxID=1144553 RepID=A0A1H6EV42_9ACTN|nr:hypothetical protein SAMN05444920_12229 [Nonomuraea solani]
MVRVWVLQPIGTYRRIRGHEFSLKRPSMAATVLTR